MKSAKIKNGEIIVENVEKPLLKGQGAILKVLGCGLCGSDIVKIIAKDENAVLGHEVVGEIVEINSKTPFQLGDTVVMGHHYPCVKCDFCKSGSVSMCEGFKGTNIFPCGFSEYIFVSEGHLENTVFKAPLGTVESTFLEPLACCVRAIRRAALLPHQKALVVGLGSIGVLMAQAIKAFGNEVCGLDINPKRQEFAADYGVFSGEHLKYDAVFMTSGASAALPTALKYVKDGGKIVVFSSVGNDASYLNDDIYYRELTVLGSYSPSPLDLKCSCDLLKKGLVKVSGLSTVYSLDNLAQAVDDTIKNQVFKAYISIK